MNSEPTQPKILIIVPAYNEADHIQNVVANIQTKAPYADIVIVNDGSSDETFVRALGTGATVLNIPYNLGIGGAVQTGYRYAMLYQYDIAIQLDGDGQHDPADLHQLLQSFDYNNIDLLIGSRFLAKDGYKSTFSRKIGIHILAKLISTLTRNKVTDTTSGYRICGKRAIALFAKHYPSDYPEVESLILMYNHGLRFAEKSVTMKPRMTGESSITSFRSIYYMIKVILSVFILRTNKKVDWSG